MSYLERLSQETITDIWASQILNGMKVLKQSIQGKLFHKAFSFKSKQGMKSEVKCEILFL